MGKNVEQLSFIENPDPFEAGRNWMEGQKNRENSATGLKKRVANNSTYAEFREKGLNFSSDIGVSTEEKAKLLRTYFPARFGKNGKQPIEEMQGYQIGAVFNHLMNYSEKRTGQ